MTGGLDHDGRQLLIQRRLVRAGCLKFRFTRRVAPSPGAMDMMIIEQSEARRAQPLAAGKHTILAETTIAAPANPSPPL